MIDLVLELAIVAGCASVLFILARALPRVTENGVEIAEVSDAGLVDRLLRRLPVAEIDALLSGVAEKTLRQIRVVNLKIENMVNSGIERLRHSERRVKKDESTEDLFEKK